MTPRPGVRRLLAVLTSVAVVIGGGMLGATGPAGAGAPGSWTSVLPSTASQNVAVGQSVATARTEPDGPLHVLAVVEGVGGRKLQHAVVDRRGRTVPGSASDVVADWDFMDATVQLQPTAGGGLRAWWIGSDPGSGITTTAIWSSFSPDDGASWGAPNMVFGGAIGSGASGLSIAEAIDGTLLAAYLDGGVLFVDTQTAAPAPIAFCCVGAPTLTALADGTVEAAYTGDGGSEDTTGVFVTTVHPTVGERRKAPLSSVGAARSGGMRAVASVRRGDVVARAYCVGAPACEYLLVWQGGGGGTSLPSSAGAREVAIAVDPAGRLWVAWSDERGVVRTARTGRTFTEFGPVRRRTVLADGVSSLGVSARSTVLDVLALSGGRLQHQQAPPSLGIVTSVTSWDGDRRQRVVITVVEEGLTGVRGARVKAAGQRCTTNARGRCALVFAPRGPGRIVVRATRPGYVAAKATLRVRR